MSMPKNFETISDVTGWLEFGWEVDDAAHNFTDYNCKSAEELMTKIAEYRNCTLSSVKNSRRVAQFIKKEFPKIKSSNDINCGQTAIFELAKLFTASPTTAKEIAQHVFSKRMKIVDIQSKRLEIQNTNTNRSETQNYHQTRKQELREYETNLYCNTPQILDELVHGDVKSVVENYSIGHLRPNLFIVGKDGTITIVDFINFRLNQADTKKERTLGQAALMLRFCDTYIIIINDKVADKMGPIQIQSERLGLKGFGIFSAYFDEAENLTLKKLFIVDTDKVQDINQFLTT